MAWFNSLSLQWKVLIIIVIVIIIWILWRKYGYLLTQLTQPRNITVLKGENTKISPEKQNSIETLAQSLFNDIQDTPVTGHVYQPYTEALALTDTELDYLAVYYKKYLGNGVSLYMDIDTQYYITSGIPAKLMARLAAIGRR